MTWSPASKCTKVLNFILPSHNNVRAEKVLFTELFLLACSTLLILLLVHSSLVGSAKGKSHQPNASTSNLPKPPDGSKFAVLPSGMKIRYTDSGSSFVVENNKEYKTLLFIHGFGGCLETWIPLQKLLCQKFRVVAIDLPGSGFSDKPLQFCYSYRNLGTVVLSFIETMDLSNVILVGHSSGCVVVASSASSASSNRVRGAVLVASGGLFQVKPKLFSYRITKPLLKYFANKFIQKRKESLMKLHRNKDSLLPEILFAFTAQADIKNYKEVMVEMFCASEPPYSEVLCDVNVPLHFIWSENDTTSPLAEAEEKLNSMIQEGNIHVKVTEAMINDSLHYIQHEQPQRLADEVSKFAQACCNDERSQTGIPES